MQCYTLGQGMDCIPTQELFQTSIIELLHKFHGYSGRPSNTVSLLLGSYGAGGKRKIIHCKCMALCGGENPFPTVYFFLHRSFRSTLSFGHGIPKLRSFIFFPPAFRLCAPSEVICGKCRPKWRILIRPCFNALKNGQFACFPNRALFVSESGPMF